MTRQKLTRRISPMQQLSTAIVAALIGGFVVLISSNREHDAKMVEIAVGLWSLAASATRSPAWWSFRWNFFEATLMARGAYFLHPVDYDAAVLMFKKIDDRAA
jgi:hypothetical protein